MNHSDRLFETALLRVRTPSTEQHVHIRPLATGFLTTLGSVQLFKTINTSIEDRSDYGRNKKSSGQPRTSISSSVKVQISAVLVC